MFDRYEGYVLIDVAASDSKGTIYRFKNLEQLYQFWGTIPYPEAYTVLKMGDPIIELGVDDAPLS